MSFQVTQKIRDLEIFEGLSESEITILLDGAEEKSLTHRATLYKVGTEAHFFAIVLEGAMKLVKSSSSGDDVIMLFATPGDVVGALIKAQDMSKYPLAVIALGETLVLEIPRRTYKAWQQNQNVTRRVNALIYARMASLHEQKGLIKEALPKKIASQFVSLIALRRSRSGTILPIPLTRQEIADTIGFTVESVIRVMSSWSQAGIIKTTGQQIEILKMDKILEIING